MTTPVTTTPTRTRGCVSPGPRDTYTVDRTAARPATAAREHLRATLTSWHACPQIVEDAELIGCELVTNALAHTCGSVVVSLTTCGSVLEIGVEDSDPHRPKAAVAPHEEESGRGLQITGALALECGCDLSPHHKVMWARLVLSREP